MANGLKLSSPWMTFYKEINELFKEDPEIKIVYDEDAVEIKLYVDNDEKASALSQILPSEKVFGNVVLRINVIPSNNLNSHKLDLFRKAFEGNKALSYIWSAEETGGYVPPMSYVVFKNKVVQFFNDDLRDPHGLCSTLYQNIAEDIFPNIQGIYFCTDKESADGTPN